MVQELKKSKSFRGFTLVELMIYVAIFSMVAVFLSSILIVTLRVQNKESSGNAVAAQLGFVLDTAQRLVRNSSGIECVDAVSGVCTANTKGSYLKLRFEDSLKDPTCIYQVGDTIKLAEGSDPANRNICTSNAANISNLTSGAVKNVSLQFIKSEVPGGHALVQIDASMTYNSNNPTLAVSRSISSVIGRVSAATFDSSILPNVVAPNSLDIGGSAFKWQDGWFSRNLNVAGNLTVGSTGNAVSRIAIYTVAYDPPSVAANSTSSQSITVTGVEAADKVLVNPGIAFTGNCALGASRVTAANTISVQLINPSAAACDTGSSTWTVIAIR